MSSYHTNENESEKKRILDIIKGFFNDNLNEGSIDGIDNEDNDDGGDAGARITSPY